MWKPEHRRAGLRNALRYPSDVADEEWALVAPLIPPAKRGGRRREIDVREVLNAIFYVLSTGCQWKALPKDLPPKSTAHAYFTLWDWDGTLERIHHALYIQTREREVAVILLVAVRCLRPLAARFWPMVSWFTLAPSTSAAGSDCRLRLQW